MALPFDLPANHRNDDPDRVCADWGGLLPDAADDLLGEAEAKALELHLACCPACAAELAEARRGAAWLSLLKPHSPEPSHDLTANILARTSGASQLAEAVSEQFFSAPVPAWSGPVGTVSLPSSALQPGPVRHWLARWLTLDGYAGSVIQPRLTMTAAMAFLSICITANMLGVSISGLHAEEFHAVHLQRSIAGKRASLLRSFQGIRIVYRVESRVNDWLVAKSEADITARQK